MLVQQCLTNMPNGTTPHVVVDDVLGGQWAEALKKSMVPASDSTARMRPCLFQLVPETWSRMRPTLQEEVAQSCIRNWKLKLVSSARRWTEGSLSSDPANDLDTDALLYHQGTKSSILRAKFGCDFSSLRWIERTPRLCRPPH
jgi:hypothetical protein